MKLFTLVFLPLFACQSPTQQQGKIIGINATELNELLGDSEVQLVDIRTPEEVSYGIIKGAMHIDYYSNNYNEEISKLDKEKPVVLYCAVGGRSASAASELAQIGFKNVYDLRGGFREWTAKGLPTQKPVSN